MAVSLIEQESRQNREHRHENGRESRQKTKGNGQTAAHLQQNHQRQEKGGNTVVGHGLQVVCVVRDFVETGSEEQAHRHDAAEHSEEIF